MYKTVKQGENSLQYTILPQTEEVLCGSGMRGKGRDYSPSVQVRRYRRASRGFMTVMCVLMVSGCVTIASLSLLGIYTEPTDRMAEATKNMMSYVTSVVGRASPPRDEIKSRKKELRISEAPAPVLEGTTSAEIVPESTTTTSTSFPERKTRPALKLFWKSSTSNPSTISTVPMVEDPDELNIRPFSRFQVGKKTQFPDVIIRPTVTTKPPTSTANKDGYTRIEQPEIQTLLPSTPEPKTTTAQDELITTKRVSIPALTQPTEGYQIQVSDKNYPLGKDLKGLKDNVLDSDDDDDFKELEVEEIYSMPPLDKEVHIKNMNDYIHRRFEADLHKKDDERPKNWPEFPMTFLPWPPEGPRRRQEDEGVMVPLLVGTAGLLLAALALTVAVARRRRRLGQTAPAVGTLTTDLQPDANTNLLTVESQEEE